MANIKPFKGIRPSKERAAKIAALPYDVYNREEAKAVVSANPESFLAIDRAETNFDDTVGTYDEQVYQKAHDLLWQWVEEGRFLQEEKPCYYLYELTMEGRSQTGIVACASIDDYEQGIIKKHENTRAEKEADRIHHVDSCNAQTGPIFLAYRAKQQIDEKVEQIKGQEPLYDFVSEDGIRHRVFLVEDDGDIAFLQKNFGDMSEIYIADGHHRAASAVRVGQNRRKQHPGYTGEEEFNYFLSVLFPDNQLMIMDYNRVVKDLNGLTEAEFLEEIKNRFNILKTNKTQLAPTQKGEFSMYLQDCWYLCQVRQEDCSSDPVQGLDVSLLQDLLLEPVLGISDPKTDGRIDFVGGIRGLQELEKRCHEDCAVAFAMYPTGISELFAVADAGRLMPPKSTWFEPKLRSGLFIHEL
jgi:uncharacterized protein (DUF1015 family)